MVEKSVTKVFEDIKGEYDAVDLKGMAKSLNPKEFFSFGGKTFRKESSDSKSNIFTIVLLSGFVLASAGVGYYLYTNDKARKQISESARKVSEKTKEVFAEAKSKTEQALPTSAKKTEAKKKKRLGLF